MNSVQSLPDLWMADQRRREDSLPIWLPWRAASRWSRKPFRHSLVSITTAAPVEAACIRFAEASTAPRSLHLCCPRTRFLFRRKALSSCKSRVSITAVTITNDREWYSLLQIYARGNSIKIRTKNHHFMHLWQDKTNIYYFLLSFFLLGSQENYFFFHYYLKREF